MKKFFDFSIIYLLIMVNKLTIAKNDGKCIEKKIIDFDDVGYVCFIDKIIFLT